MKDILFLSQEKIHQLHFITSHRARSPRVRCRRAEKDEQAGGSGCRGIVLPDGSGSSLADLNRLAWAGCSLAGSGPNID